MRANCQACPERAGKQDTKHSFAFNMNSGFYHCLRCGLKGFVDDDKRHAFVSEKQKQRSAALAEEGDVECRVLPKGFALLDTPEMQRSVTASYPRAFLDARKITAPLRVASGIGACLTSESRFAGRVVCPLRGEGGQLVGFVTRSYVGSSVPYLYPKGMERGELLYGGDKLYVKTDAPLVIVEGFFDALYLSQAGDAGAVLGMPSNFQLGMLLEALLDTERPVVFALDGDAWQKGIAYASMIHSAAAAYGRRVRVASLRLPGGIDPDDLPAEEVFEEAAAAVRSC